MDSKIHVYVHVHVHVALFLDCVISYICCEHPSGIGGFSPFFTNSVMTLLGSSAYGASPREAISHRVIPNRQLEGGREKERRGEREREREREYLA
jgi:hypothetical protein